jgi:pimeloyl-ACP methyl ester carboxylesterase
MINELKKVDIGGIKQSILVKGQNNENPILLMLHGGPGFPLMPFSKQLKKLEEEFIVVYWDQRGAGKSYSEEIPSNTMTIERFLKDAYEVIQLVKYEYGKERIFLAGHSWGSILGINLAHEYPSEIYAYIGISQVVDFVKGNEISYQFALKTSKERNMTDKVEKLIEIGDPHLREGIAEVSLVSSYVEEFGGTFHIPIDVGGIMGDSEVYSTTDIDNINKGMQFSAVNLIETMVETNLVKDKKLTFEIPIIFLCGKYDYTVPSEVVLEYYEILKAPSKEVIWLNESAHFCYLEETENFIDILFRIKKNNYYIHDYS